MKKWRIAPGDVSEAKQYAEEFGITPLTAAMLIKKGYTDEIEIEEFLSDETDFADPYEIKDMDKAVERISDAVENGEKICIYGDFDADGVTSTTILYLYLKSLWADVMYYIPARDSEGYGLNNGAIDRLHEQGVDLIITVDNGISAYKEVAYANSLGIDTVVTDHHTPPEKLPDAVAVVDPQRSDDESSFKAFCGAGVAFKLVMAMERGSLDIDELLDRFADICALGTVADIVSLTGENRMIVKEGLRRINENNNFGISLLRELSGLSAKEVTAGDIGFYIAPRINAGGRLDLAVKAVELLTTEDEDRAREIAEELNEDNNHRKQIEKELIDQAVLYLDDHPEVRCRKVLVVAGEGWHPGVIGLVASKIKDRYGKPTIILSYEGDKARGSARSVEGFPMITAVTYCSSLLSVFGGHLMAAGMSLPKANIDAFRDKLNEFADTLDDEFLPTLDISLALKPGMVKVDDVESLRVLEPYGTGNLKPVFMYKDVTITAIEPLKNGQFLKFFFSRGDLTGNAVCFIMSYAEFPYEVGDVVSIAVDLGKNEFRGEVTVSSTVKDIKFADDDNAIHLRSRRLWESYVSGAELSRQEREVLRPTRDDLAAIYKYLRDSGGFHFAPEILLHRVGKKGLTYGKLMLCLRAMEQVRLIRTSAKGEAVEIELLPVRGKVDVMAAPIITSLN